MHEHADWVKQYGHVVQMITVQCDYCDEPIEVVAGQKPNQNGLWVCNDCLDYFNEESSMRA